MRVAVLGSGPGWHTRDLVRALEARGHEGRFLPVDSIVARVGSGPGLAIDATDLGSVDGVLLRTFPRGSLEQIVFRIDALHHLERLGVPVLNPARVIERTVDKFHTSALLEQAGLPTPRTVVAENMDAAMEAFRAMGDVIVKPLFGSNGRGIVRVDDEELAYRVFRALALERAVYYVQEAVPSADGGGGRDLRVFIVGGVVAASIWRTSDGWRTNLSRGARAARAELCDSWRDLALGAARVVGAEYAGVDLFPAPDGTAYVLEVNGSPGWRGLQPFADTDIAGAIVGHLESLAAMHDSAAGC